MKFRILLVAFILAGSGVTGLSASTDQVLAALHAFDAQLAKTLEPALRSSSHTIDRDLALGLAQLAKKSGFDTESTAELILATARKGRELQQRGMSPLRIRQQLYLEGGRAIGESRKHPPDKRLLHIRARFDRSTRANESTLREKRQNQAEKRRDEKRYSGARGGSKDKKDNSDSGNHR